MSNFTSPTHRRIIRERKLEIEIEYLELYSKEAIAEGLKSEFEALKKQLINTFEDFAFNLKKDMYETEKLKQEQVNQKEKLLDIGELAAHFGKTKQTVHNWRVAKIITGKKMGKGRYFSLREVEEALNKHGIAFRN